MYPVEVRRQVFELLGQGLRASQVAVVLGVSTNTIVTWRGEVGGVIRERSPQSARYLSREERYEIARLRDAGLGVRVIAVRVGRSPATISRELARPGRPAGTPGRQPGRGGAGRSYQPEACHQAALAARARPRATKLSANPVLKAWVQDRLDQRDSPAQVSGRLRVEFPDQLEMRISHETIYRAIYVRPRGELRRELRAHLRTGRDGRLRRNAREPRTSTGRPGQIIDAVPISERPEEVESRLVPGHYEGDLVVGPLGTRAAIGTLVERTSGHLTAYHLPIERTARANIAELQNALSRTGWPMKTLTWDRGKEMAAHAAFTIATDVQVYFADPHAPWQRGSNESANGLLRQYFPKGLDLATITDQQLQAAVNQLNDRPRKRHGFLTPNEILAAILNQDQSAAGVATTD